MLKIWCDREIDPGVKWEDAILRNMDTADMILLMVSAAYYDSSYIHDKELKYALMRHEKGEATVIPLIVRPCKFHVDPIVSSLQALPKDARPVTSWNDRDDAWLDIMNGIEREIERRERAKEEKKIQEKGKQEQARQEAELATLMAEEERRKREEEAWERERSEAEAAAKKMEEERRKREEEQKEKQARQLFDYPMIDVIGGTFTMGSPQNEKDRKDNECQHKVTLTDFQIGKYPVTQKQWIDIMGSNPSDFKGCDTCPVESVSWNDIQNFIEKLNKKTGMTYRLPTEEEWEYAAKGGKESRGYIYAGSDNLDDVAWFSKNSNGKTHAVGEKLPNELGIHDMSGNVWEWCQDWYKSYPGCSGTDSTGVFRVYRGGSWNVNACYCRASYRYLNEPHYRADYLGFRLAASAPR